MARGALRALQLCEVGTRPLLPRQDARRYVSLRVLRAATRRGGAATGNLKI